MSSCINDCKRVHRIEVEPLQQTETQLDKVEHSILLLKGRVQPNCAIAKQLKATLKQRRAQREQLTQLSNTGEFKLLLDLKDEQQREVEEEQQQQQLVQLHLSCCNGERQLQFVYQPRRNAYRVQPLYLVCCASAEQQGQQEQQREAEAQVEAEAEAATTQSVWQTRCALIDLNLRLVQCIYAHKLSAAGFGNRTFSLNGACSVFHSQLSCEAARGSSEDELWQHFASEILASSEWGQQLHLKFVAFIGCTRYDGAAVVASGDYSYANIRRHLYGHAALGGGGLALFGTGHFYAWPQTFGQINDSISSTQRVDVASLPDESNYRRTYGGVYASTLGAVCHELGHCFDLGHTLEGVMGHGFDYLNRVLTVDQPTEHLPQRIVSSQESTKLASSTSSTSRPRFTQLKLKQPTGSKFLDNYHAQRRNDSFYFTRNCAVILAQHRWLRSDLKALEDSNAAHIQMLPASSEIVSSIPLRLVELRCNRNSLVAHYEEFPEQPAIYRFQLPDSLWHLLSTERTHYAFVLTIEGDTKRLACDSVKS